MYALFAYLGGDWAFAGIDPHEECAVMFIDAIDGQFGDGTAQVFKFPDKADHSPIADQAQDYANLEALKHTLKDIEAGSLDLDDALKNLKNFNN